MDSSCEPVAKYGDRYHTARSQQYKFARRLYGQISSTMTTPTQVEHGDDAVDSRVASRRSNWHAVPYILSPSPKPLFLLKGPKHEFGGFSGQLAPEADDESSKRLAVVQRTSWAYLRSQLYKRDNSWAEACKAFKEPRGQGKVE